MRYIRRGRSKVRWLASADLTAIADISAPTTAELAAAVDITAEIQNLVNFEVLTTNGSIAGHGTPFVTQFRARSATQGTPELVFFDNADDVTVQALLAGGLTGFLLLSPEGSVSIGERIEVWPVQAHGAANGWTVDNAAARWSTQFATVDRPNVEAVVA